MDAPPVDVITLVSHATQDRLKTLVSKLSVIAEHRLDIIKAEGPYEVTSVSIFQFTALHFENAALWLAESFARPEPNHP